MKGYAVEYCTPYKATGRVFVPADMYIAFFDLYWRSEKRDNKSGTYRDHP